MASPVPDDLDRYFATTVSLVTTRSSKGDNVMAAEWTFNVSYDPMIVAVFVNPRHATHAAILEAREFGVSMASEEQLALCSFAGGFSHREADKLTSGALRTRQGDVIGAPLIEGALAQLECKLVQTVAVGDHTAFFGEVLAARVDPSKKPLILYRGYRFLGEKIPRGHHLFATLTPEGVGRMRVDGMYYAEAREGAVVSIEAFNAAGASVAGGSAVTDRGGFFEWRPDAEGVAKVVASTADVRSEARRPSA